MEYNMEQFKKKLECRRILFLVLILIALCLGAIDAVVLQMNQEGTFETGMVVGFQAGLITSIAVLSILQVVKITHTLKDSKKLRLLYNQEKDERMKLIRSKAGMPMLLFTSIGILIAAIIAGYFNTIVFLTLFSTAFVQLLLGVVVKAYYMKKL